MLPRHALPLISALALAFPAHALTAAATSASGTNGSTATATTTSPSTVTTTAGSAASSALLPSNQTSGSLASGQVSSGTGTRLTTGVRPIDQERLGIVPPEAVPATSAPVIAGGETIGANGERIAVETIAAAQPAPAAATPTPDLDAATRAAERKLRAKTARKQQLMHSIVPRTNVDRTDQMPDDPISPAVR